MGIFSFLFGPPAPTGQAPHMSLRRFAPETSIPPDDYTVIDLETTGLDACICEILEIGAIRFRNHQKTSSFHSFIRPEGKVPTSTININHITWSKVSGAPCIDEISDSFFEFLGNDTLVGYNIGFDIKFIQTRFGIDINNLSFDVLPFVREIFQGLASYKLDSLRKCFNIGGDAHNALGDCWTTALIFQKCLNTPQGQEYVGRELEGKRVEEQESERLRIEHEELKEQKRADARPPQELRELSKRMVGDNNDYIAKALSLIEQSGRDTQHITTDGFSSGYETLMCGGKMFLGVKTSGNLRYITLDVPINMLRDSFDCAPSSFAEGNNATRIFISSPNGLEHLREYIFASFDSALSYYHARQKLARANEY